MPNPKTNEPGAAAILAVLSLAFLNGGSQMLSPAVANLSAQFPDLPYAAITMIMTVVNMVSLPVLLAAGAVAGKKVKFRPLCLFGTALFAVGGVIPFFVRDSYAVIMASRVLVAVGAGCVISLPATLAFRLFTGDRAQRVQGWSNAASSIFGAVMMMVVGLLASISTELIWLSHLMGAASFLLVALALPEPEPLASPEDAGGSTRKEPMPAAVWGLLAAVALAMIGMYPVLINSSLIIAGNRWGDADLAGTCNAISSAGSFVAGLIFGAFYARFPRVTPLFCGCLAALGSLAIFFAPAYPVLVAGAFLVGWGFMQLFCYLMGAVGVIAPPSRVAFAMSCVLAANNLAVFAAPYVGTFIQACLGTGDFQAPFAAYAVLWMALGATLFAWHPDARGRKPDAGNGDRPA